MKEEKPNTGIILIKKQKPDTSIISIEEEKLDASIASIKECNGIQYLAPRLLLRCAQSLVT